MSASALRDLSCGTRRASGVSVGRRPSLATMWRPACRASGSASSTALAPRSSSEYCTSEKQRLERVNKTLSDATLIYSVECIRHFWTLHHVYKTLLDTTESVYLCAQGARRERKHHSLAATIWQKRSKALRRQGCSGLLKTKKQGKKTAVEAL